MPLRDGQTPSSAELDALAQVGPHDMDRASALLKRATATTPRRALGTLLDATPGNAGPATGPIPDE